MEINYYYYYYLTMTQSYGVSVPMLALLEVQVFRATENTLSDLLEVQGTAKTILTIKERMGNCTLVEKSFIFSLTLLLAQSAAGVLSVEVVTKVLPHKRFWTLWHNTFGNFCWA